MTLRWIVIAIEITMWVALLIRFGRIGKRMDEAFRACTYDFTALREGWRSDS